MDAAIETAVAIKMDTAMTLKLPDAKKRLATIAIRPAIPAIPPGKKISKMIKIMPAANRRIVSIPASPATR